MKGTSNLTEGGDGVDRKPVPRGREGWLEGISKARAVIVRILALALKYGPLAGHLAAVFDLSEKLC